MGSPLSPILSNLFMELIEHFFILNHTLLSNTTWLRYVDDIFVSTPLTNNPTLILNYINSIHPNIKFTMESSNNKTLPFLDTLHTWNNSCLLYTSDAADERS